MEKFFILIDWSSNSILRLNSLGHSEHILKRVNISLAPLVCTANNVVNSHDRFLYNLRYKNTISEWYKHIERLSVQNCNLLFLASRNDIDSHKNLLALLSKKSFKNLFNYKAIFIVGDPISTADLLFRCVSQKSIIHNKIDVTQYIDCIKNQPQIIQTYKDFFGEQNIEFIIDHHNTPILNADSTFFTQLLHDLGCNKQIQPFYIPHQVYLSSPEARSLLEMREVHANVYPSLDNNAYIECLQRIEKKYSWKPGFASPLEVRQELAKDNLACVRKLESACKLPPFSISTAENLLVEAPTEAVLDDKILKQVVEELPVHLALPLIKRFANDAENTSYEQKIFLNHLKCKHHFLKVCEPTQKNILTVLTMTYQHEKYIAQCIESVMSQKTNFPFQLIILDHCSTDDTPNIIKDYASRYSNIRPVLLPQRVIAENVLNLFLRAKTPYVALCDGDDYFTDPLKLQKQYDFLEANQDCALCFHPVKVIYEDGTDRERTYPPLNLLPRGVRPYYYLADLLKANIIQTNSVMYRWRFAEGLPEWFQADLLPGDWYWHILHAEIGKIGFINEIMAVYRRHKKSLYYSAEIGNTSVYHRYLHGMNELRLYDTVRKHFFNKYDRPLQSLANGVFADFLQHQLKTNDDSLMNDAVETYPHFAKGFLQELHLAMYCSKE